MNSISIYSKLYESKEFVRQLAAVRQCGNAAVQAAVSDRHCVAVVFLVVRVWQCTRQCAAVQQCGSVWQR
jgi:hypothetical protein